MNLWLEEFWQDVHATLLVYARDQLNAELPPDLHARVDERLAIDAEVEKARTYVPDVAIAESWDRPSGSVLGQGGLGVAAAEPTVVDFGQQVLRRLEIEDSRAHVITAIELLSPSNKSDLDAVLNCAESATITCAAGSVSSRSTCCAAARGFCLTVRC